MNDMERKVIYYTKRQKEGIETAASIINFGVSLTVASAINELYTAHMILRECKDVYCREVKMLANKALNNDRRRRAGMLSVMCNRDFFDTYCDKVIDLTENDITKFRLSMKQILDNHKVERADLLSYVETARSMLELAKLQFEAVCRNTCRDYAAYKYEALFSEFDVTDVFLPWHRMSRILYASEEDINLNTDVSGGLFEKIVSNFADGVYSKACMQEADRAYPEVLAGMKE